MRWRVHPDEPLHIGRKGTAEPCFFMRGAIDEVRLFNRVLTAGEIGALTDENAAVSPDRLEVERAADLGPLGKG